MSTQFFHFMHPIDVDDESIDEVMTTKQDPIEHYDEQISLIFRQIQELLPLAEPGKGGADAGTDEAGHMLDELFARGATYLQQMHHVIVHETTGREQEQWKEIIEYRFVTFQHLQQTLHHTVEYLGTSLD
jgi:hypothetical protein